MNSRIIIIIIIIKYFFKDNEARTGEVGEGDLAFESEVFLVEYVNGVAGDDERSTTWTITTTIILGHHARVLHRQHMDTYTERHRYTHRYT